MMVQPYFATPVDAEELVCLLGASVSEDLAKSGNTTASTLVRNLVGDVRMLRQEVSKLKAQLANKCDATIEPKGAADGAG